MESGMKRHRRTSIATHLFACFTSRFSSSFSSPSMKISSKSVASPGRPDRFRDPAFSSLSRRLRSNNGSTKKGQASPMFHGGTTKKRDSVLENPEPSSPKVSCIGQVRVKTRRKKRKKKRRRKLSHAKSQRRGDGEASSRGFGKYGGGKDNGNQKWVHLPLILCCEAFRAFGSDPSCFLLPRRSSTGKDGSKGRGIESQISEENERDEEEATMEESSWRRRGLGTGEIEIRDFEKREIFMEGKSEEGRAGVCVPPKNALLLMRCRSDPHKMSALTTRLCESFFSGNQDECSDEEDDNDESEDVKEEEKEEELGEQRGKEEIELNPVNLDKERLGQVSVPGETIEGNCQTSEEEVTVVEMEEETPRRTVSESSGIEEEEVQDKTEEILMTIVQLQGDPVSETQLDPGISGGKEDGGLAPLRKEEQKDEKGGRNCPSVQSEEEMEERQVGDPSPESGAEETEEGESTERDSSPEKQETEARFTRSDPEQERPTHDGGGGLADSLLLQMLREPKLSMEVSRETWVRSTDFIGRQRRLPPANPMDGCRDDEPRKRKSTGSRPSWSRQIQPPRSSCSLPMSAAAAGASMAAVIGEKIAMP